MSVKIKPFVTPVVKPAIKLDASTVKWERDVYEADPTGGQPSRY